MVLKYEDLRDGKLEEHNITDKFDLAVYNRFMKGHEKFVVQVPLGCNYFLSSTNPHASTTAALNENIIYPYVKNGWRAFVLAGFNISLEPGELNFDETEMLVKSIYERSVEIGDKIPKQVKEKLYKKFPSMFGYEIITVFVNGKTQYRLAIISHDTSTDKTDRRLTLSSYKLYNLLWHEEELLLRLMSEYRRGRH